MSQRTMGLFTGTACFRNIIRVTFKDSARATSYNCRPEKFDNAIKDLAGFRKLVVEFRSTRSLDWRLTPEQALAVPRSQCKAYKESMLKDLFEPAYGPAVRSDVEDVCNGDYACYVEFHPRHYLEKDLIVKAGKMLEEVDSLAPGKRIVASLPEIVETLKIS